MTTGRQSFLQARGRASFKSHHPRGVLRWLPAGIVVGAMLAMSVTAAPAALASDPPTVTITSGVSDVTYMIGDDVTGEAFNVGTPHVAWEGSIAGASWINTTGGTTCDQACDTTATYTSTFSVDFAAVASVSVAVLADNVATVSLNSSSIGAQDPLGDVANFKNVSTFSQGHVALTQGSNTLSIDVLDLGVANGLMFEATITYVPVALDVDFTANDRGYDGTNLATGQIAGCSVESPVLPGDVVTCSVAAATFDSRNAGPRVATGTGFSLDGAAADFYSIGTKGTATATIAQAPLTVTAADNVKTANGDTSALASPMVTSGTIYSPDSIVGVFTETYDTALAGAGKVLTPAGVVSDVNSGNNYSYTYATIATGRIRPGPVAALAFTTQPIDTKVSTPIYSVCAPPVVSGSLPCASSPTSTPIQVTARDTYGNLAGPGAPGADPTGTAVIPVTIRESTASGAVVVTTPPNPANVQTTAGVASFGDRLKITSLRTLTNLYAEVTTSLGAHATSQPFQVVSDLEACVGTTCDNVARNVGASQTAFGKIFKSLSSFGGSNTVTLTTQFISNLDNPDLAPVGCRNPQNKPALGQMSEVKVQGGGVSATAPNFTMVLTYPKKTLQDQGFSSRGTDKFNVCLGATVLSTTGPNNSTTVPWKAMRSLTDPTLVDAVRAGGSGALSVGNVYWGWVPTCAAIQASNLSANQKLANPCISLRTKQVAALRTQLVPSVMTSLDFTTYVNAIGLKDSDIAIVISKPWPWDGKGIVR